MLVAAGLAACSSNPDKAPARNPFKAGEVSQREQRLQASQLYAAAHESLESSDYDVAVQRFNALATRFPFTEYAIQGQLETVYAEYRAYKSDEALIDADHFLRDFPRHAHADYVQYLKGLINFERERGIEGMLGLDVSKRDVTSLRRSFDDFQLLVQRYPNSKYIGDARLRMIDLRNRMADHEMTVVRYYMRRGAYVAAAKRAEQIVAQYPGSPITVEALESLEDAYRSVGLKDQAGDARKLYQAYVDPVTAGIPTSAQPARDQVAAPPRLPDSAPLADPGPNAAQAPTSQTVPAVPAR